MKHLGLKHYVVLRERKTASAPKDLQNLRLFTELDYSQESCHTHFQFSTAYQNTKIRLNQI